MEIKSQITGADGKTFNLFYKDADSFEDLSPDKVTQAYGVCLVNDKLVITHVRNNHWSLVGGTIEKEEKFEEALKREIREESNMKINYFAPIGYQEIYLEDKTITQLRYLCIVEPYGPFVADPAGGVTEIKLIDPKDYKQYIDWLKIGDRIIERAMEMLSKYNKNYGRNRIKQYT